MKQSFHPSLQKEFASIILKNNNFARKFHAIAYRDIALKSYKVQIFSNESLNDIIRTFYDRFEKSRVLPSVGVLKDDLTKLDYSQSVINNLIETVDELYSMTIERTDHHEKEIEDLLQFIKAKHFYEKELRSTLVSVSNGEDTANIMMAVKSFQEQMSKLTFKSKEIFNLKDMLGLLEEVTDETDSNIPTPIPELNEVLNGGGLTGGIARQEVTLYAAPVNQGKSLGVNSFAVHAAKSGYKTLVISLEGKKKQAPVRAISTIAELEAKKISMYRDLKKEKVDKSLKSFIGEEKYNEIIDIQEKHGDMIRFVNLIEDCSVENIIHVVKELYQEDPFDLLVIDYGQLIRTQVKFPMRHLELTYIFRELEILSSMLNLATLVPMQFKNEAQVKFDESYREGKEYPTYNIYDIAECTNAGNTAGCVLTWNRSIDERNSRRGRIAIAKQRDGIVNFQVGIEGKWDILNPLKGKVYYKGFGDAGASPSFIKEQNLINTFNAPTQSEDSSNNEAHIKSELLLKVNELLDKNDYSNDFIKELKLYHNVAKRILSTLEGIKEFKALITDYETKLAESNNEADQSNYKEILETSRARLKKLSEEYQDHQAQEHFSRARKLYHLTMNFKDITPKEYLKHEKLIEASQEIVKVQRQGSQGNTPKAIAERTGFYFISLFNKVLKEMGSYDKDQS